MEVPERLYSIKVISFPKKLKIKQIWKTEKNDRKSAMERIASETILSAQH